MTNASLKKMVRCNLGQNILLLCHDFLLTTCYYDQFPLEFPLMCNKIFLVYLIVFNGKREIKIIQYILNCNEEFLNICIHLLLFTISVQMCRGAAKILLPGGVTSHQ